MPPTIARRRIRFAAASIVILAVLASVFVTDLLVQFDLMDREAVGWSVFWQVPSINACVVAGIIAFLVPRSITIACSVCAFAIHLAVLFGIHPK